MKNKINTCNLILSIGNIINGILGIYSGRRGFSIFMIIIGALCLAGCITEIINCYKDKDD